MSKVFFSLQKCRKEKKLRTKNDLFSVEGEKKKNEEQDEEDFLQENSQASRDDKDFQWII